MRNVLLFRLFIEEFKIYRGRKRQQNSNENEKEPVALHHRTTTISTQTVIRLFTYSCQILQHVVSGRSYHELRYPSILGFRTGIQR